MVNVNIVVHNREVIEHIIIEQEVQDGFRSFNP